MAINISFQPSDSAKTGGYAPNTDTSPRLATYYARDPGSGIFCRWEAHIVGSDGTQQEAITLTRTQWQEETTLIFNSVLPKIKEVVGETFNPKDLTECSVTLQSDGQVSTSYQMKNDAASTPLPVSLDIDEPYAKFSRLFREAIYSNPPEPVTNPTTPTVQKDSLQSDDVPTAGVYYTDLLQHASDELAQQRILSSPNLLTAAHALNALYEHRFAISYDQTQGSLIELQETGAGQFRISGPAQLSPDKKNIVPIRILDNHFILLYQDQEEQWHYYDPKGAHAITGQDNLINALQTHFHIDNIQPDPPTLHDDQPADDTTHCGAYVLRKVESILREEDLTTAIELYRGDLAQRITPSAFSLPSPYPALNPTTLKDLSLLAPSPPAAQPSSLSQASIIVGNDTPINQVYQTLRTNPDVKPLLLNWKETSSIDSHELLLRTGRDTSGAMAVLPPDSDDTEEETLPVVEVTARPIEDLPPYSYVSRHLVREGTIPDWFAPLPPSEAQRLQFHTVDLTPIKIDASSFEDDGSLSETIVHSFKEQIYCFLNQAKEEQHHYLVIPAFPMGGDLTPDQKHRVDQVIAAIIKEMLMEHFHDQTWTILFAITAHADAGSPGSDNRDPATTFYHTFAAEPPTSLPVASLTRDGLETITRPQEEDTETISQRGGEESAWLNTPIM